MKKLLPACIGFGLFLFGFGLALSARAQTTPQKAVILAVTTTPTAVIPTATSVLVWPVGGGQMPNLPQSSAYGPRLKASNNYVYDYHQGVDIPLPVSTTLVAVTTGTVRIAGSSPSYSDSIVQLDHGNGLYSNYIHVSASLVTTGQVVTPGQAVALSGIDYISWFPHLHFELRQGSYYRKDAVNPWRFLPYNNTVAHTVAITEVLTDAVWVQVTQPATELDFNSVALTITHAGTMILTRTLDYEARNRQYNGDPNLLDVPDLDNILIDPAAYTTSSSLYVVGLKFHDINLLGTFNITVCAYDVRGFPACANTTGTFGNNTTMRRFYLPSILYIVR